MITVGIRVRDEMGQLVKNAKIHMSHQPFCAKTTNLEGVADGMGTIMFMIPEDKRDEEMIEGYNKETIND